MPSVVSTATNGSHSLTVKLPLDSRVRVKIPPDRKEERRSLEQFISSEKMSPGFLHPSLRVIRLFLFGWFYTKKKKKVVKRGHLSTPKG